ncbi:putative transcription factor bHLH041 [Ziziphus jujuba]|uniref:Transcription factor bHLH041 n=1 Tax=Ziziphus jujuba TaxID=326968 RepID=A0ABM3ISD4_ZIZJJ|nr:putative transcription factor bHLH041 [Ziziphus jujuba]XP_048334567.1 putative transcription factor bHLH041 [Ziziphus jujuba]XP_048334568.1 putative transcription factor bHLH041 [Ziziphus jujuba]
MDTAFLADDCSRANYVRVLMQNFGCTYICLWSYLPPPSNCLKFLDGFYNEEKNQPSSSSGTSLAHRLFDGYRGSLFFVLDNDHVPGFAFRNNLPYFHLQEPDLQRMASNQTQRQFYQEARIQAVVFMGCKSGEIELGFSNESQQVNINMETMKTWFPEDFARQLSPQTEIPPRPNDQNNPPSSSSSSLISLTMDSPEYSSLLFSLPMSTTSSSSSQIPETSHTESTSLQPLITPTMPHQQAMQAFARLRNIQFPSPESEAAAMTRAMLAVLSSPSSSSSTSHQPPPPINLQPHQFAHSMNPKASLFKKYAPPLGPNTQINARSGSRQSMLKRSFSFFTNLNIFMRNRQRMQENRPSSTQLHHMMSERKRREKLNESFHALRSLLPPGTKKDKASVLTTTREYLTSLQSQISELTKRIQQLEAQVLPSSAKELANGAETEAGGSSSSITERVSVRVSQVSESTSSEEGQLVDLRVILRTHRSAEDVVIRILEFLKRVNGIRLLSMEADSHITKSSPTIRVTLRLRVDQGNEWDESAFQEAVRRFVEDLSN